MPSTKDTTAAQDPEHDLSPVEDLTEPLALRSKRTERRRRKLERVANSKSRASTLQPIGLLDLPLELLLDILELLRPSDLFTLRRVSKQLRAFIRAEEAGIVRRVINLRYPILERCFVRPVLLTDVDPAIQPLLQSPDRQDLKHSHRIAHQNIPPPDDAFHCTCLTCVVRWNALCAVVDFTRWQDNLDNGVPIPAIPRGSLPPWNRELLARNRRVVLDSLTSPLGYARILEAHLDSTTRSIRRHSQNKADRRRHFHLTEEEMRTGADAFLQREGPPTFDYPYSRELYYMLEAFLPGRSWIAERQKWVYASHALEWHQMDLAMLVRADAERRQLRQNPAVQAPCALPEGHHPPILGEGDAHQVVGASDQVGMN
jgi:hypothetical protein